MRPIRKSSFSPYNVPDNKKYGAEGVFKIKFYFSKKKSMRFISHLDLMRLFLRAARRAELPLFISSGFSPRPKLSIKRALKLGLESEREEAEILLTENIPAEEFCCRLNKQLPEGIRCRSKQ